MNRYFVAAAIHVAFAIVFGLCTLWFVDNIYIAEACVHLALANVLRAISLIVDRTYGLSAGEQRFAFVSCRTMMIASLFEMFVPQLSLSVWIMTLLAANVILLAHSFFKAALNQKKNDE